MVPSESEAQHFVGIMSSDDGYTAVTCVDADNYNCSQTFT